MNMNVKGRQTKLLAAIAVLAMVVCVMAVVMPAETDAEVAPTVPEGATSITSADKWPAPTAATNYTISGNITLTGTVSINEYMTIYILEGGSLTVSSGTTTVAGIVNVLSGATFTYGYNTLQTSGNGEINVYSGAAVNFTYTDTESVTTAMIGSATSEAQIKLTSGSIILTLTADQASKWGFGAVIDGNISLGTASINNSAITVNEKSNVTVTGNVTSTGVTVTNNGSIALTGTATMTGVQFDGNNYGDLKSVRTGTNYYATISQAIVAGGTDTIAIHGDYNNGGNIELDSIVNVDLMAGASYSGTISYGDASVTVAATEVSKRVTLASYDASSTTLTVSGNPVTVGTDGYMSDSDVVVTNVTNVKTGTGDSVTYTTSIDVNGVAFSNMTLNVPVSIPADGSAVVPYGTEFSFGETDGKITMEDTSDMYVLGILKSNTPTGRIVNGNNYVSAMDTVSVAYFLGTPEKVEPLGTVINLAYNGSNGADIVETLRTAAPGTEFNLYASGEVRTLIITGELSLQGITIYINKDGTQNNVNIQIGIPAQGSTVATPASVSLNDVTIDSTGCSMTVSAGSTLDIVDSLLFIAVTGDSDSITVDNEDVEYTNTTDQVKVGYGTTLNLTGNVRSIADVYGNLVISNTATVPAGTVMNVYAGGSVTVDGTLTILGTAKFVSESELVVNGTVVVGNNTGGAVLDVDGNMTINENATVTVTGIAADLPNKNKLQAPDNTVYNATTKTYTDALTVLGTLNMNGALSGKIVDKGTIVLNGFAVGTPVIYIYDGVTLEVGSIAGSMEICDDYAAYEMVNANNSNMEYANGNSVTISNVRGFTVTDTVVEVPYADSNGTSHIDYYAFMTIGGQVSAITGTTGSITVADAGDKLVGEKDEYYAYTTVAAETTMQFGANVSFAVNGDLVVAGDIEFLDAGTSSNKDEKKMTGSGEITVTGEIAVSEGYYGFSGIMNAAQYRVTVTGTNASVTDYYTGFAAAIAAAPEADNDTVNIYGAVEVPADVTIAAGIDVLLQQNSTVKIGSDAEVILSDGAEMRGPSTSKIVVEGMFTAQDYKNDLGVSNVNADVVIVEEPAKTWTSLANAIAMGETEITLNQDIVIDEDTTIPAGVTVNSEYDVTIDDATLTVNGALNIDRADLTLVEDTDAELVVGGVTSVRMLLAGNESYDGFDGIAGAHYGLTQGAYITYYVSSMDIAAQNVNGKTNVHNDIVTVVGSVSAGEIAFQAAANHNLQIVLAQGTADEPTFLSVGSIDLDGNVKIVVPASNALFTGTVTAPVADGTADTSIQMSRVGGITVDAYSVLGITTEYIVSAYGAYSGAVTVGAGELIVGKSTNTDATKTLAVGTEGTLDIASGASMEIPNGMVLDVEKAETVEVAGTVTVKNASGITGVDILVTGTMNVEANLNTAATIYVAGALNVAEDYTMAVGGKLVVGTAPESLGVGGSLAGDFTITSNATSCILAYAGADLTQAKIQWNDALSQSNAETTTYVINGVEYATVYATGAVPINGVFGTGAAQEEIDLAGLVTTYNWYKTEELAEAGKVADAITTSIGTEETVYAVYSASVVSGIVTNGAGIDIFIDGAKYIAGTNEDGSSNAKLSVGTHKITYEVRAGWDGSNIVLSFNGQTIQNGDTITITADMTSFTLSATGAINSTGTSDNTGSSDDGMGLTDYLLIILVVLIVVMAIMVALRLMRS